MKTPKGQIVTIKRGRLGAGRLAAADYAPGLLGTRTFMHRDFYAPGLFGTETFRRQS